MDNIYQVWQKYNVCYDPKEIGIPEDVSGVPSEILRKYRGNVKNIEDVIWAACRKEFISDKTLRLFACWCARRMCRVASNVPSICWQMIHTSECFANGDIGLDTLVDVRKAAEQEAYEQTNLLDFSKIWMASRTGIKVAWLAAHDVSSASVAVGLNMSPIRTKEVIINEQIDRLIKLLEREEKNV